METTTERLVQSSRKEKLQTTSSAKRFFGEIFEALSDNSEN